MRGDVRLYVAQARPKVDTARAKKHPFRTETREITLTSANPRRVAYDILLRIDKERSYADILLNQELTKGGLLGPDRALLTELVYGTLRRQGTLDHIIGQFSNIPVSKLERTVLHLPRRNSLRDLESLDARRALGTGVNIGQGAVRRAQIDADQVSGHGSFHSGRDDSQLSSS